MSESESESTEGDLELLYNVVLSASVSFSSRDDAPCTVLQYHVSNPIVIVAKNGKVVNCSHGQTRTQGLIKGQMSVSSSPNV